MTLVNSSLMTLPINNFTNMKETAVNDSDSEETGGILLKNQETFYNNYESIAKKTAIDSQSTNIQSIAYMIFILTR